MPSLEDLWAQYGAWLERHVSVELGGDDGVHAACYLTMVEAGRRVVEGEFPRSSPNLWPWFEEIAADACHRVRAGDYDETAIPGRPMPGALPTHLRSAVRRRRMREWLDWRFGKFSAVVLLPEIVVRARESLGRMARTTWRRAGALVPSGTPNAPGMLGAVAGSGMSEAAVAAAAVVILGIGGGAPAEVMPATRGITADAISQPSAAPTIEPQVGPRDREVVNDAVAIAPRRTPGDTTTFGTTSDDGVVEAPASISPEVHAETKGGPDEPVREQRHDGGKEFVTPEAPATADLEGDGEAEATVQPPLVFVDCVEPEERGPVTSLACDVVDDGAGDA